MDGSDHQNNNGWILFGLVNFTNSQIHRILYTCYKDSQYGMDDQNPYGGPWGTSPSRDVSENKVFGDPQKMFFFFGKVLKEW